MIDGVDAAGVRRPPLAASHFDGGRRRAGRLGRPGPRARLRRARRRRRSTARLDKRREELRAEVERAERKLGNEGFVAKAPAEVVEEERGKLERYRAELAELG